MESKLYAYGGGGVGGGDSSGVVKVCMLESEVD